MNRVLQAASLLIFSVMALFPHSALAAEHCSARVDSVDEDRAGFDTRPIWTGSLFSLSLLSKDIMPVRAAVRIYTLGGQYQVNVEQLRWYPTDVSAIYRSAPVPIAFDQSVTFLHAGLINYTDSSGFHECVPQLFGAFNAVPRLTLAPIQRAYALSAQSSVPHPPTLHHCLPTPARIAVHAPTPIDAPPGAPTSGGPFISLIAVRVAPSGAVQHTRVEVSSGFPWLDEQTQAFARQQTYAPASIDCKSASGLYYFAGRFDTPGEGDLRNAF